MSIKNMKMRSSFLAALLIISPSVAIPSQRIDESLYSDQISKDLPRLASDEHLSKNPTDASNQSPSLKLAFLRYSFSSGLKTEANEFLDIILVIPGQDAMAWRSHVSTQQLRKYLISAYHRINTLDQSFLLAKQPDPLYNLLFAPIRGALESHHITTLIISADTGLQGVPFASLHDGQSYLAERYSFSLTPSIMLTPLRVPNDSRDIDEVKVAFGATKFASAASLPFVPDEIQAFTSTGKSTSYIDSTFTESALISGLTQPSTAKIHIASHAEFGENKSIIYTSKEFFPLEELAKINRRSSAHPLDLVYLSACKTAIGSARAELGFSGLALQIGARSAIGSLWNVNDLGASVFAILFYRYLSMGLIKAEAVMAARVTMIQKKLRIEGDSLFADSFEEPILTKLTGNQKQVIKVLHFPYYWSGVMLIGSPW